MSLLTKYSLKKETKKGILKIAQEAEAAAATGEKVINGTIGMLYNEEGELATFKAVKKAEKELTLDEKYAYTDTAGTKEFREAIVNWVFGPDRDEIIDGMYCACVPTAGGTGAVALAISNYLDLDDKILIPDVTWNNYKQIAYQVHTGYETFSMFNENGEFDIRSLKRQCLELKKTQKRLFIIINDPCHNPTGYSMSYEEWISLVIFLNEIAIDGTPIVLFYDMAYIDYDNRGLEETRKIFKMFKNFKQNIITIMGFSGSKTLGLYGLRIGASIVFSHNKNYVIENYGATQYASRSTWSVVSTLGLNIVTKVLTNYKEDFMQELTENRAMLSRRVDAFLSESEKVGLEHFPFKCGFFISIPYEDPQALYDRLIKQNVYIVPMEKFVRVALCSLSEKECRALPKIIKENM